MPVVSRNQIADYRLLSSRHFFPGYYLITKGVSFGQDINLSLEPKLTLKGSAGANLSSTGIETVNASNVLSMPIIITQSSRYNERIWRDGLDFIIQIMGSTGENISTSTNKIFRYNGQDYDASAIKKISIVTEGNSDISVNIEFATNVENVFDFKYYGQDILSTLINPYMSEMRTARAFDIMVGVQTLSKQTDFRVMTKCGLDFEFIIDEVPLWGSKKPRNVYNWCNFKIAGDFNLLDDLNQYTNFVDPYDYDLYKPDFQRYNQITLEEDNGPFEFALDFSDIAEDVNIKFSSNIVYNNVSRSISEGVLQSNVKLFSYN